jgi:adenine phosphoribosyltransferase
VEAGLDAKQLFLESFRWTDGHADFAGVFRDDATLAALGPGLVAPFQSLGITAVVGVEARGFVLGALAAQALGVGLVLARKRGSVHPGPVVTATSAPDWRGRRIEFELSRVLVATDRVVIVDDWIETGSQATAVAHAIEICGAQLAGTAVLVDQTTSQQRERLNVKSVVTADELPKHA